jgi:hypothetical protein
LESGTHHMSVDDVDFEDAEGNRSDALRDELAGVPC